MRFIVRKRRSPPAVIIVALIDVLIVLVIFLMVTTTFKQVPSLKLTLPASRQALRPGVGGFPAWRGRARLRSLFRGESGRLPRPGP